MRGRRSTPKLTPAQREACYRLKLEGRTGKQAAEILEASGFEHLKPFSVSAATVNRIARELASNRQAPTGGELASVDPLAAVDVLARELVRMGERHLERLRSLERSGRLKTADIRGFAALLRDIRREASSVRRPPATEGDAPAEAEDDGIGWLEDGEQAEAEAPPASAPVATGRVDTAAGRRPSAPPPIPNATG